MSCDVFLEAKREDNHACSVLCCVRCSFAHKCEHLLNSVLGLVFIYFIYIHNTCIKGASGKVIVDDNYERRVTLRYAVGGARSRDGATNHSGVPAVLNVLERASQTHEICSSASLP